MKTNLEKKKKYMYIKTCLFLHLRQAKTTCGAPPVWPGATMALHGQVPWSSRPSQ